MKLQNSQHEWLQWLDGLEIKLNQHIADRNLYLADHQESVMMREVFSLVCDRISKRDALRMIFFSKLDNGEDTNQFDGQYWLNDFIANSTGAIVTVGSGEFSGMISVEGGIYPMLNQGMMVNLPVAAWSHTLPHLAPYRQLVEQLDRWMQAELPRLKRDLVSAGSSQMQLF